MSDETIETAEHGPLRTSGMSEMTPMRLGMSIRPLKVSEISHAREEVSRAPEMMSRQKKTR